jgi:hypothetical protein
MFFKAHYKKMRYELEGPKYFKKTILNSFSYKESEIIKAVKTDLHQHLELYYKINPYLSAKAKILHFANDYGQLDVLISLQEPLRKIDSYLIDEEKIAVAKTNYIVQKRAINYLENSTDFENKIYEALLISTEIQENWLKQIQLPNTIILVHTLTLKEKLIELDYEIEMETNALIVLKKRLP